MKQQYLSIRILIIGLCSLFFPLLLATIIDSHKAHKDIIMSISDDLKQATEVRALILRNIQPIPPLLPKMITALLLAAKQNAPKSKTSTFQIKDLSPLLEERELVLLQKTTHTHKFEIIATSSTEIIHQDQLDKIFTQSRISHLEKTGTDSFISQNPLIKSLSPATVLFVIQNLPTSDQKPQQTLLIQADMSKQISQALSIKKESPKSIKFAILDDQNLVFAANDQKLVGQSLASVSQKAPFKSLQNQKANALSFFRFFFHKQLIAYRFDLPDLKISMIGYALENQLFSILSKHFVFLYSFYGSILIAGCILAHYIAKWSSHPLQHLCEIMDQIAQGDLDIRFKEKAFGFEINKLGKIFNNTLDSLLRLTRSTEKLRIKKELYKQEIDIGNKLFHQLLPSNPPSVLNCQIATAYLAIEGTSSHFFDYLPGQKKDGEETIMILLTKKAEHGIFPALYALSLRSSLKAFATISGNPQNFPEKIQNILQENSLCANSATALCWGTFYTKSKTFSYYYSCNHHPPILRQANGKVLVCSPLCNELSQTHNNQKTSLSTIQLFPNDLILFCSHDLFSTFPKPTHLRQYSSLCDYLTQSQHCSTQLIVNDLMTQIQKISKEAKKESEIVVIGLKIE